MANIPMKARHHNRARPSVWGREWHINASGAAAINNIVMVTRMMKMNERINASSTATNTTKIKKMPTSAGLTIVCRMIFSSCLDAAAASTPCPSSAAESPFAKPIA